MNPNKILRIERTGQETGILTVERYLNEPDSDKSMSFEYSEDKSIEKYVFFLTIDELYSLARSALNAASEKIEIRKPGSY